MSTEGKTVQVIMKKEKQANRESGPEWAATESNAKNIERLATEVDKTLTTLSHLFLTLNEKIKEAYVLAPEKDCGFNSSPLGPAKLQYALRMHLNKCGMTNDRFYMGDATKLKFFKDSVSEGLRWLLKFSN